MMALDDRLLQCSMKNKGGHVRSESIRHKAGSGNKELFRSPGGHIGIMAGSRVSSSPMRPAYMYRPPFTLSCCPVM
jgi:hypothetical protein